MRNDVVSQVHCLTHRSKANQKRTFANNINEDLDTLCVDVGRDEDDDELEQQDAQPAGVDDDNDDAGPQ